MEREQTRKKRFDVDCGYKCCGVENKWEKSAVVESRPESNKTD